MNKKICFLILLVISAILFVPNKIFAADLNVSCPIAPSGCTMTGASPLFSQTLDGFWYPGMVVTKTINIKNVGTNIRQMVLKATEKSAPNILKQVMSINIAKSGGTVIWSGSLNDFYNQSGIVLGMLNQGANQDFNFRVNMDVNANNDYQGLTSVFDLTLGFWGEAESHSARISGFKYYDLNGNNKWDGWLKGEFKIAGWMIFIDKNNNKRYDKGERFDITEGPFFFPDGRYSFDKLDSGSYNICEIQLPGWESSLANHSTCQEIAISVGQNKTDINFGNRLIPKRK